MQRRIRIVAIVLLGITACGTHDKNKADGVNIPIADGSSKSAEVLPTKGIPDLAMPADGSTAEITETKITPLVPALSQTSAPLPVEASEGTPSSNAAGNSVASSSTPAIATTSDSNSSSTSPSPSTPDAAVALEPIKETTDAPPAPVVTSPAVPAPTPAPALSVPLPLKPVIVVAPPSPSPPASVPVVDTYESALADISKYRSDIAPFKSDDAETQTNGTVWLGDGVNVLNGERTPTCLALGTLSKQTSKINQTQDNFEFVDNYYDFWKKMSTSTSLGGSGTFPWFTLGLSVSVDTNHDVYITKDDIVAVASFNYKREEQTLYNARPAFAPYFSKVLTQNKGLFRMLCGDSFTKSVSLGGSMRIVFNAKKRDNKEYKKDAIKATLNLGFTNLFSLNSSFGFTKEQQEILKSYSFSMKCYTAGTRANICAGFGLNTTFNFDADGLSLQQRMDDARKRMAADVDKGDSLVIVDEKFASYEAPIASCTLSGDQACPAPEKIYYDYRPRIATAFKILSTLEKMDEICTVTSYWKNRCTSVKSQFTDALRSCSQSNTPCSEVKDREQIDILLSAANPGNFSLWVDIDRKSNIYSADFNGGDASGRFISNTFFVFSDIGWDRVNDKASSAETHLAKGWKVRFWENKDTLHRGNSIDMQNGDYISNLWKMNDKFSAFELIPPPDLGD